MNALSTIRVTFVEIKEACHKMQFRSIFLFQLKFFSFLMHYAAIPYLKSSNFIIFGNEHNRSES